MVDVIMQCDFFFIDNIESKLQPLWYLVKMATQIN